MLTCEPLPRYSAAFSACLPHSVHWIAVDSSSRASPEPRRVLLIAVNTALAILPSRPFDEFELDGPGQVRVTLDDRNGCHDDLQTRAASRAPVRVP